eukprot:scaffold2592_cov72-Phaeocystis_antarctica.AAC.5
MYIPPYRHSSSTRSQSENCVVRCSVSNAAPAAVKFHSPLAPRVRPRALWKSRPRRAAGVCAVNSMRSYRTTRNA